MNVVAATTRQRSVPNWLSRSQLPSSLALAPYCNCETAVSKLDTLGLLDTTTVLALQVANRVHGTQTRDGGPFLEVHIYPMIYFASELAMGEDPPINIDPKLMATLICHDILEDMPVGIIGAEIGSLLKMVSSTFKEIGIYDDVSMLTKPSLEEFPGVSHQAMAGARDDFYYTNLNNACRQIRWIKGLDRYITLKAFCLASSVTEVTDYLRHTERYVLPILKDLPVLNKCIKQTISEIRASLQNVQ